MDKGNQSMEYDSIRKEYNQYVRKMQDDIMSDVKTSDIQMYNPSVLAYIGDSVYELFVRTLLVSKGNV
ncbi:hypothetical protein [Lutispora thermophila]|uniref:Ribonuclease-3 family protein n=1 Tax=Lutispora thermophila DSM 19022 TaxID=1122184 RepID=A0A1M6IAL6_9FIRM|nr:hypothetical protein [Lutispora thermophila]SHJ31529.1 ribonuclease-3 family protein [Lutispora thermophila DSM 19022]